MIQAIGSYRLLDQDDWRMSHLNHGLIASGCGDVMMGHRGSRALIQGLLSHYTVPYD